MHHEAMLLVKLRDRRNAGQGHREDGQRLGRVVRLRRATGDVDDGNARGGGPAPAEVVTQAHRARRVVLHRRDAAVRRAGAQGNRCGGLRREAIDPLVRGDRLTVGRVDTHPGKVALAVDLLVRNRSLDDEDERVELAGLGVIPGLHELGTNLVREHGGVCDDLREPRDRARDDVLETRIDRRCHGDRVAVAAQT